MRSAWTKWAVEHHTFSDCDLSAKEVSGLSEGAKETLDNVDKEKGTATFLSVKYGSTEKLKFESQISD